LVFKNKVDNFKIDFFKYFIFPKDLLKEIDEKTYAKCFPSKHPKIVIFKDFFNQENSGKS